jgi:putative ABC transport system permease protein
MDAEVRAHFEMRVAELRARGLNEPEAEAEALRRFGDTEDFRAHTARRATRRARSDGTVEWLTDWTQDIRFAARQFNKHRAFTALAVATLALGIGANAAIFTVVHRLLISPLPYPDGNHIVALTMDGDERALQSRSGPAILAAWQARAHSVESIAAMSVRAIQVQDIEEQDTIPAFITSNFLHMLGVKPALGREFRLDEERTDAGVAMITYHLWQRSYGGRADAIGAKIQAEGKPYTIVGVTPPEMGAPISLTGTTSPLHEAAPSIWLPGQLDSIGGNVFARLRAGVSAQQASKELQSIAATVPRHAIPPPPPGRRAPPMMAQRTGPLCCAHAIRAQDLVDPAEARAVEILFVAVAVLLLIACANVANLLMARAWTRRREFAVRVALGAGRGRLARLVLTESVTLALAGGLFGIGIAWETLRIILALRPPALANLAGVHVDAAVLLWSVGVSVFTGILFGSAPALLAGRRSVGDVLRSETRAGSGDGASGRMRSTLIVAEVAMSLVLLAGAALLVQSFIALQRVPLGYDPHNLVAMDILLPMRRMSPDERLGFERAVLTRLQGTPGVSEAAIGTLPSEPYQIHGMTLETEADAAGQSRSIQDFSETTMSPNYFHLARMSLVEGRLPDSAQWTRAIVPDPDANAPPEEIVINRELARRLWPNGGAVGARLRKGIMGTSQYFAVVGIVEDIRLPGRGVIGGPGIYQLPLPVEIPLIARLSNGAHLTASDLRRIVAQTDPRPVAQTVINGDDYLRNALAPTRFAMALLVAFAVVALMLSAIGLYGVIAYSVSQRTREIGIRVALGAEPSAIVGLVARSGLTLAIAGALIGVVVAAGATRTLTSMLYGVRPGDPVTFVSMALLVGVVAVLASFVPARRALRIDPIEALRAE